MQREGDESFSLEKRKREPTVYDYRLLSLAGRGIGSERGRAILEIACLPSWKEGTGEARSYSEGKSVEGRE